MNGLVPICPADTIGGTDRADMASVLGGALLLVLPVVDQLPISMACHPLRTLQVSAVQPFGLLWFCNRIKPKDFTGRFLPWDAIRVGIQQPQIRDEH